MCFFLRLFEKVLMQRVLSMRGAWAISDRVFKLLLGLNCLRCDKNMAHIVGARYPWFDQGPIPTQK